MICQRCHDNRARFLVESDCTLDGVRIKSRLLTCARCAWDVTKYQLPGHRYRELTLCEQRALDSEA